MAQNAKNHPKMIKKHQKRVKIDQKELKMINKLFFNFSYRDIM